MIFSFYFLLIYRLVQLFITIWLLYKDFITINVILSIVNNKKGDRMHYYKRLRELREDHDLTQKDVAKLFANETTAVFPIRKRQQGYSLGGINISCKAVQSFCRLHFRIERYNRLIFICKKLSQTKRFGDSFLTFYCNYVNFYI